jgi:hypothetical protein
MLIKSGLSSNEKLNPLDVEGAKQLQHISSQYQGRAQSSRMLQAARSKTMGAVQEQHQRNEASLSPVSLEHLIQM